MSYLGKRRNPYSQSSRPSYKRPYQKPIYKRKRKYYAKKAMKVLSSDLNYAYGALVKTNLPAILTEDSGQQPWRLVPAATFQTPNQPARDQEMFNALPFGTAPFSRIGNKIVCKYLHLHLKLQSTSQKDVTIRYVLVQKYHVDNESVADLTDEDNNPFYLRGTEMNVAALNDTPPSSYNFNNGIMSLRDMNGTKDFKILLDKKVTLRQGWNNNYPVPENAWTSTTQTDPHPYGECNVFQGIPQTTVYKDHYIDLKDIISTYSFSGDSSISNNYQYLEHNGIYLIACTDYVGSGQPSILTDLPSICGSWRMCYMP